MKELTIEKLVPLLTSPVWYKRLVGEYYEVIVRLCGIRNRLESLCYKSSTPQPTEIADILSVQTEIELVQEQLYIMQQYADILYRRLVHHGIPYVDILSEALPAQDVLTDLPESPKAGDS